MKFHVYILVLIVLMVPSRAGANDDIEQAGDILQLVLPLTALGQTFEANDLEGRSQFLKSAALAHGITGGLKVILNRQRPNGGDHSFPSGHTTAAFVGASFFQKRYGWKAGLPAYALAAFVGYSRVQSRNHYPVDVFAGAAIGIASSYLFTSPRQTLQITPYLTGDESGVAISIRW